MIHDTSLRTSRAERAARRWRNIPVPVPHLVVLVAAGALELIAPLRIPVRRRIRLLAGAPVTASAVALGAWAVASASRAGVTVDRTDGLVRRGAFAVTRNPMYLAWSGGLLGVAVLTRSTWLLLGTCAAAIAVHRDVLREEAVLDDAFGDDYRTYRASTPRYLRRGC